MNVWFFCSVCFSKNQESEVATVYCLHFLLAIRSSFCMQVFVISTLGSQSPSLSGPYALSGWLEIGPFAETDWILVLGEVSSEGCLTLWSFWCLHNDISAECVSILSRGQRWKFMGFRKLEKSRGKSYLSITRSGLRPDSPCAGQPKTPDIPA